MLQECVDVFDNILQEKSEQWFFDSYVPKDGTYVLINMDRGFAIDNVLDIKTDKTGIVQGMNDSDYSFISYMDYYSKLIEMNKPIDSTKQIHSNNMYSFFVKKESLKGKLTDKSIDGYYSILKDPYIKYKKTKDKELYSCFVNDYGNVDTVELDKISKWIKDQFINCIQDERIDLERKDYLKLFFIHNDREQMKKLIKTEGQRYININIFNKNDYNVECASGVKGVPSNNMGLNSKKPFLENKTRKVRTPYMLDIKRTLLQSMFFDYLSGQAALHKNNIYVDLDQNQPRIVAFSNADFQSGNISVDIQSGLYLRVQQGKELEIHNTVRVTDYSINLRKDSPFYMNEVFKIPEKVMAKFEPGYGNKTKMYEIETLVDYIFFSKMLRYNYFTKPDELTINNGMVKSSLLMYREMFFSWFYTGNIQQLAGSISKIALGLIKDSIKNNHIINAKHQFNLWISISDYLKHDGRLEKVMKDARESLMKHIDCKDEWMFDNDLEYYYTVGQIVNTFLSYNRSTKKDMSIVLPVVNAKSDLMIKKRLASMFKKYAYSIQIGNVRIKSLFDHVMRYTPTTKNCEYMIMAGMTGTNLVFRKKDSSTDENVTA